MTQEIVLLYLLYLLLNLFNTIIISHQVSNKYIVPFKHTFKGEFNAILGNLFTLNLVAFILLLFTKNLYWFSLILLILTGALNLMLFLLNVFNLYFGNAFTKDSLDMFKNPIKGISKGLGKEIIKELFNYYRIILFMPFFIFFTAIVFFGKSNLELIVIPINLSSVIIAIFFSLVMILLAWIIYERMYFKDLTIKAVKSTYGIQNFGVYPFYLKSLFKLTSVEELLVDTKKKKFSELTYEYNRFNKNKLNYENFINKKVYSNELTISKVAKSISVDKSLLNGNQSLTGILAGKNLVLVQMESMSRFLLDISVLKNEFPFVRALLEECVDFTEFYSSVGMGVSSDAEVTTLTGLYATGYNSLYWSKFDNSKKEYRGNIDIASLPKYFNQKGYHTEAVHGDYKRFYNREFAYPNIIGFQNFFGIEDFPDKKVSKREGLIDMFSYEYSSGKYHISPWVSDYQLADTVRNRIHSETKSTFLFPITMMPHTPFEFYPDKNKTYIETCGLKEITKKYLRFSDYYDDVVKRVFIDDNGNDIIDSNTVFLFYGDHGCGIKNGDVSKLFQRQLSHLEERRLLQQLVCFLYVPGEKEISKNGVIIKEGLIKGKQNLVRGHMDIYRTVIELFGLKTNNDAYFGTHLLSDEPTFVLDNKLQDVIMDNDIFSMRNKAQRFPKNIKIDDEIFESIKEFKILNDILIEDNDIQSKLNEELKIKGK